jgi:hypothetical protein
VDKFFLFFALPGASFPLVLPMPFFWGNNHPKKTNLRRGRCRPKKGR